MTKHFLLTVIILYFFLFISAKYGLQRAKTAIRLNVLRQTGRAKKVAPNRSRQTGRAKTVAPKRHYTANNPFKIYGRQNEGSDQFKQQSDSKIAAAIAPRFFFSNGHRRSDSDLTPFISGSGHGS